MSGMNDINSASVAIEAEESALSPAAASLSALSYMPAHTKMVTALKKPDTKILSSLAYGACDMLHMAVGISGESGELLDAIKKHIFYEKPLDRENVIEELGDLEFYMEGLRQNLGIAREETLKANIAKLGVRYMKGNFSNEQAQERADKEGEE